MARKQRVKVRVKQKKSLWQILKIIVVIALILGVLSFLKSCSDYKFELGDGKFSDFLAWVGDVLPGGFIDFVKPGDSGEPLPDDSGALEPELPPGDNEGDENPDGGEEDNGDTSMNKHSCDALINSYPGYAATCISTGLAPYFECSACHTLFNSDGNETTAEELTLPINANAHSLDSELVPNSNSTHNVLCTYDNSHVKATEDCIYSEFWSFDAEEHYHKCDCQNKRDNGAHYDNDEDSACDVCNYEVIDGDGDNTGGENTNPSEPEEPTCEHVDANDDNLCDSCGEEFSDGTETPDEPQEPEEPACEHVDANDDNLCDSCGEEFSDGTECQHLDADDNGECDKCGEEYRDWCHLTDHYDQFYDGVCDICGYEINYRDMPGSAEDNKAFAYAFEYLDLPKVDGNVEILSRFEVAKTEVNVGVLYWNDKFYGEHFTLEIEETLYIVPTKVETDVSLYKIRIKFATKADFDNYAHLIASENNFMIYLYEDELTVEICYSMEDEVNLSCNFDRIYLTTNGTIPRSAIASFEVETIIEVPKYD